MQGYSTLNFYPNRNPRLRFFALWYFCTLLIIWNVLGHTVLGFEQAPAQPIAGVLTAIAVGLLLEYVDARARGRTPRFAGSLTNFLNFLPPCVIPGLACAMLIFSNELLGPVVFAAALSLASKVLLRAPIGNGQTQHIFNPSNFGITMTLFLIPAAGLAPPYQFTENVTGAWHWVIPGIVLLTGLYIHAKFTGRLPLVLAWWAGFVLQAVIRIELFHLPWVVPFVPMTSAGFILFSLYMIPDPATTPIKKSRQVMFGLSVALIYGVLFIFHVVFGLFVALAMTSALRAAGLYLAAQRRPSTAVRTVPVPSFGAAAAAGR